MKRRRIQSPVEPREQRHGRVMDPVACFCLHMVETSRERVTRGLFSHLLLQRAEFLAYTRKAALGQAGPLL